ncbi:MAG: flagellar biosynthetic protein FliO [Azoarcus sp.]|jgi:flagellar protein FliO/FliZ|nr:flagellar biosynthetic protein FliO [Azoarcus sp.]
MNASVPVPVRPPRAHPAPAIFTLALAFALPGQCLADAQASPAPDAFANVGQMLSGLLAVLVLLIAALWLLKRFSTPARGNALLRVIAAAAVGPRERAVLLEAGGKIILLGVTSNNVHTLHVFGRDEFDLPAAVPASPAATFASRLRQALKGRRDAG